MRVGYVQFAPEFGEVERNLDRVAELLAPARADLWVLPELFATGYQFASARELELLAEPVPDGPTTARLIDLARESNCHIVAGLAERADNRVYNSAVLVGPSGLVARYRKVHLFYEEKHLFAPGDLPFPVADIGPAKVGLLVCYDHFFPEAARSLALQGAEVIAHPANLVIPGLAQLTMRVRAIENRVFTVTANRIGVEARTGETLRFTGLSQIVAPNGDVLAQGPQDAEEVRAVAIDPTQARDKHLTRLNDVFADRRPEFYRSLVTDEKL
ncbi:acyltransferase [Candidatus Bipolaricaulota bacterium]|nr:acyltransferase [Candidatus Bipolaricaulota bacterium]